MHVEQYRAENNHQHLLHICRNAERQRARHLVRDEGANVQREGHRAAVVGVSAVCEYY